MDGVPRSSAARNNRLISSLNCFLSGKLSPETLQVMVKIDAAAFIGLGKPDQDVSGRKP